VSRLQLAAAEAAANLRELAALYRAHGKTAEAERTDKHAALYERFARADR
jgi:hypothetical protein